MGPTPIKKSRIPGPMFPVLIMYMPAEVKEIHMANAPITNAILPAFSN